MIEDFPTSGSSVPSERINEESRRGIRRCPTRLEVKFLNKDTDVPLSRLIIRETVETFELLA